MNKSMLYVACALVVSLHAVEYQSLQLVEDSVKAGKSPHCTVAFVQDVAGAKYVIKQYKHGAYSRVAAAPIGELVTLDMGHRVGVLQNRACLIPAHVPFIGKTVQMPATVHEHAPGIRFDTYKGQAYQGVSICQHASTGLTYDIIQHMSCHHDLPKLVALDTFVGNTDRGAYNFFYDELTDSFMGIDMGGAFSANLCAPSLENIQKLMDDHVVLSEAQEAGLQIYYHTLKQLVELYPPASVCAHIDEYAALTGLFNEVYFDKSTQKKWIKYLDRCKQAMRQSYSQAVALVALLEQLVHIRSDDTQKFTEPAVTVELDVAALAGTLHQYKKSNCMNSVVVYCKDAHENSYVVKQFKNPKVSILLATTISELVALEMGLEAGVSVDRASLIPAGVPFEGKSTNVPAAIHTHAPGIRFDKYKGDCYAGVSICQKDNQGLTREIIYHMSRHKDLAGLVALDTFVGNNDRNARNYFYDQATDSFMGIDMGASFRRDFCKVSTDTLVAIFEDTTDCLSEQELRGLSLYKETLKVLVKLYPPDRTCDLLDAYIQNAGLYNPDYFGGNARGRWAKYFGRCKQSIQKSYQHACSLIEVLESLGVE